MERLDLAFACRVSNFLIFPSMSSQLCVGFAFLLRHYRPSIARILFDISGIHFTSRGVVDVKLLGLLGIAPRPSLIWFLYFSILQFSAQTCSTPLHQLIGLEIFIIWCICSRIFPTGLELLILDSMAAKRFVVWAIDLLSLIEKELFTSVLAWGGIIFGGFLTWSVHELFWLERSLIVLVLC